MKKLITTDLDGHPVYFKDFEFIQEQIRELAQAVFANAIDGIVYILTGCESSTDSGGTISINAGCVWYNGEMFFVDAHQAYPSTASNIAVWHIEQTNDPRGRKMFYNKIVKQVYQVRKLKVIYTSVSTGSGLFSDTVPFNKPQSDFEQLNLLDGFGASASAMRLSIRSDITGTVHILGVVTDKADWMSDKPICKIPSSLIPAGVRHNVPFLVKDINNEYLCLINQMGEFVRKGNQNRYGKDLAFDFTYKL